MQGSGPRSYSQIVQRGELYRSRGVSQLLVPRYGFYWTGWGFLGGRLRLANRNRSIGWAKDVVLDCFPFLRHY